MVRGHCSPHYSLVVRILLMAFAAIVAVARPSDVQVPAVIFPPTSDQSALPEPRVSLEMDWLKPAAALIPLPALALHYPDAETHLRQDVLELIHYPWQELGYEIAFLGPRKGLRAMTFSRERRIEVYARPGDPPRDLAFDLAHELGHVVDLKSNTPERRAKWRQLRGIDAATPWFACDRCADYRTGAGDFAETFAFLLLGPGNYSSRLALAPDESATPKLAAFCGIPSPKHPSPAELPEALAAASPEEKQ